MISKESPNKSVVVLQKANINLGGGLFLKGDAVCNPRLLEKSRNSQKFQNIKII